MTVLGFLHLSLAFLFTRKLKRYALSVKHEAFTPRAAVILALRGSDPLLKKTLEGLSDQDYGDYTVFLIIDSRLDSSIDVVKEFLNNSSKDNFRFHILRHRKQTCSLKCSALIEALSLIDESYRAVAFIDADAPPQKEWLKEIISPLQESSIGVVTGNRWYVLNDTSCGSLIRYMWNSGAVAQMWINEMVWAGSMAMRMDIAKSPELLQKWETSLSVDAMVTQYVKTKNLKVHFSPLVMMINTESTSLILFWRWVQRQFLAGRLSGEIGYLVWAHVLFLCIPTFVTPLFLFYHMLAGNIFTAMSLISILILYLALSLLALLQVEKELSKYHSYSSSQIANRLSKVLFTVLPSLAAAQAVSVLAFFKSFFLKEVQWRQITYKIAQDNSVKLVEYRPYQTSKHTPGNLQSID